MFNFETISEERILSMAYDTLLDRWLKEIDIIDRLETEGKKAPIAKYKADSYYEQMQEINARLIELSAEAKGGLHENKDSRRAS